MDNFQLALHCMGVGDLCLARQAQLQGDFVAARFHPEDLAVKSATYCDSVSLYNEAGVHLELIALEKRCPLTARGSVNIRVQIGL